MKYILSILLLFIVKLSVGNNDTLEIAQKIIDLKELEIYFHKESPERHPFIILDNGVLPSNIDLVKFNKKVVFLTSTEIFLKGIKTAFSFNTFQMIDNNTCIIKISFKIEGITAEIRFKKTNNVWSLYHFISAEN